MGMPVKFSATVEMRLVECYKCHTPFYMPEYLDRQCRQEGRTFYCPNGHDQVYSTSEVKRLKKERAALQQALDWEKRRAKKLEKDVEDREKGIRTLRHRAAAGLCPCCNRHFPDLMYHISSKHPEFAPKTGQKMHPKLRDALVLGAVARKGPCVVDEIAAALEHESVRALHPRLRKLTKQGLVRGRYDRGADLYVWEETR